MPDEELERQIDDHADGEDDADQRRDTHELCHKLARIAVEQARDAPVYAVPASAVVAGAVCEQPDGEHAPQPVGAVHGNGANSIVNFEDVLEEAAASANQEAGER